MLHSISFNSKWSNFWKLVAISNNLKVSYTKRMSFTMVDMSINFQKLYHFEGVGFKRWQKRMHFVLVTFKVVYVLSTPKPLDQSHWRKRMNLLRYSQKAEMGERRLFVVGTS